MAYGGRVVLADLNVHIAHRRIECAGVGIRNRCVRRHRAFNRLGGSACCKVDARPGPGPRPRPTAGKQKHVSQALLVSWRVVPKHKHRTRSAISDDAHRGPHVNRARDPISSRRNEKNSLAMLRRSVNRCLEHFAVIGHAIAMHGEVFVSEINGLRVLKLHGIIGSGRVLAARSRKRTTPAVCFFSWVSLRAALLCKKADPDAAPVLERAHSSLRGSQHSARADLAASSQSSKNNRLSLEWI